MPYQDGNLTYYNYGEDDSPCGAGLGAQDFSTIVDEARASGQRFEDPYFPADASSYAGGDINPVYSDGTLQTIKWFRPTEIAKQLFKSEPIFHGEFNEFAVHQGSVGDCWFQAVMADIGLQPECIRTVIPQDNSDVGFDSGAFHFRFWCKGKWVDIVVDDRLACIMNDDSIDSVFFCSPSASAGFWTSLLEKAYAKMYGCNYINIDGGSSSDAMLDFTGGFVQNYIRQTPADPPIPDLINILKKNKKWNSLIALSTMEKPPPGKEAPHPDGSPGDELVSADGITMGHAYSFLDIQDVPLVDDPSKTITLIKIRNPWGSDVEWTGAFGDKDDDSWATVTTDLRRKSADRLKDGEFWASYDSFVDYIQMIDVCRWSGHFRGNENISKDGMTYFMDFGNFSPDNSGEASTSDALKGKAGYYVHLKPAHASSTGETKNGLNYNCGILADMIYLNYTKSGTNPNIPTFGFYTLWAPGFIKPEGSEFFDNILGGDDFGNNMVVKDRRANFTRNMPSGTLFIIPWTEEPQYKNTDFYIRIAAEGEIKTYSPN